MTPGQIILVDRGDALLGQFSEQGPRATPSSKLTEAGAEVRLGRGVTAVHPDRVELDDGSTIPTRTVVWGGGESGGGDRRRRRTPPAGRPHRRAAGPDRPRLSRASTPWVTSPTSRPATSIRTVAAAAGVGGAAVGPLGGREHRARARRRADRSLRYKDKGIMAMIGRNAAVAEVGKHRHQVEGPLAFAAWLGRARDAAERRAQQDRCLPRPGRGTTSTATTPPRSRRPRTRSVWPGPTTSEDVPHIDLDRPRSTGATDHTA